MTLAFWAVAGLLFAVAVIALSLAVLLTAERRSRQAERAELAAELDVVREQVRELQKTAVRDASLEARGYVITRLGSPDQDEAADPRETVPNQLLLSAAFGEPLVKVLALGHGLRRALGAESRNRIGFEVRREVRRSRKVRRREMREAWRSMRAERTAAGVSTPGDLDAVAAQPARSAEGAVAAQPARSAEGAVAAQPARSAEGDAA